MSAPQPKDASAASIAPEPAVVVALAPDPGFALVGLSARERNRRVSERAGARVIEPDQAAQLPPGQPLLALRSELAINLRFFSMLGALGPGPRLLGPAGGPDALFGSAAELAPWLAAYFSGGDAEGRAALPRLELDPDAALSVATPALARAATRTLLRLAAKPTDGIVSRHLNRPVSRFFSRILLGFGLGPTHASAFNLALGLACAHFAAQTGYASMVAAGVLFQFASAFDGVDGEMARTTLSESPRGAWIDTMVDNLTYLACLFGVSVGWAREGVSRSGLALAVVLLLGLPLALLWLSRFVRTYSGDGSFVFIDRCVERAAQDSGMGSLKLARFFFYALRRDVFAALFCLISFSGSRAAIPIAVAAGLAIALATLLAHRPRLLAAAQALAAARR